MDPLQGYGPLVRALFGEMHAKIKEMGPVGRGPGAPEIFACRSATQLDRTPNPLLYLLFPF